jgi:hypothetical protein
MTYYKLTDKDGNTRNGMHWDVGVTNQATGEGKELCSDGFLHVYDTPEQAALMRSAHAYNYTRLWEVESWDEGITDGTKRGVKKCTVIREMELQELTVEQRVEIGIRVSMLVYKEKGYIKWAKNWLSGKDRSASAASAAAYATSATHAEAYATSAASHAVDSTAYVAHAAAYAVASAASEKRPIDLIGVINQVLAQSSKEEAE